MSKYEVGYRKPPKDTQFKKGASGNPRGRPKRTLNLVTDLTAELSEKVTIREDGRSRTITKQRALIKSLTTKALKGDPRATAALLALHARVVPEPPPPGPETIEIVLVPSRYKSDIPKMIEKLNEPSSGTD